MLSGQSAAAGMVRDFHERQTGNPEELGFSPTQLHEDRLAQGHRRLTALLKFDSVVDTPRCARPSGAQAGDHGITPADEFLHDRFGRALHMRWLGLKQHFNGPVFFLEELR